MQNKLNYLLLLPLVLAAHILLSQPIGLDPTFGTGGVYTFTDGPTREHFVDVAVQPNDGKPVAVGYTDYDDDEAFHYRLVVMRFLVNGTPDPTFGYNGKVYIDFPNSSDEPSAVTVHGDKILIAGNSDVPYSGSTLPAGVIFRLNSNGTLDNSFGVGGRTYISNEVYGFENLVVRPDDGYIVASGFGFLGTSSNPLFSYLVARFKPDGTLDPTVGSGKGYVKFRTSSSSTEEDEGAGYGLALQKDGKILSCGYDEKGYGNVVRLKIDGTLDPTFGSGGILRWDYGRDVFFYFVAQQNNGNIVLGGYHDASSSLNKAVLRRLLPNGNDDPSFSPVPYGNTFGTAYDMEIQADGKYVLGGLSSLIRVKNDGKEDASFDGDGYYNFPLANSSIRNLKLNGSKIYVVGHHYTGSDYNGFIARVTNNSSTADHEIEGVGTVSLAPNPARDLLGVTFQQPESASGEVLLEAFDLAGRVVHSSVEQVSDEVQIPVSDWPNGMYYLSITATGSGARRTVPFVVQH